ncbi:MAG: chorismate synthase [Proteobacteria bacterium]|nr:chorismate synthase [Pseudomonadota bacterium]
MSNTFGRLFRITTWGESHGHSIGVVVDGCPPRLPIDIEAIQRELDRRRPGQSRITTQRREADRVKILSGVYHGRTLGTSIALMVENADARGKDYSEMRDKYRPSHADYTYQAKYGIRAVEGGGRASARETVGRVAGGAVARLVLDQAGIEVVAWVDQVSDICARVDSSAVSLAAVEANIARCPDPPAAEKMIERIDAARKDGDSLGGVVRAVARNVPAGLGAPVFGKLDADLAGAMLGLPAAKGFEVGSGFAGVTMTGSEHNDPFYIDRAGNTPTVRTRTNHSGGIQGGISNGESIEIAVAFKPTATILRPQQTVDTQGREVTLKPRGRHDPCVLPRAVPIVEAMMALVLADHLLYHRAQCGGEPVRGEPEQ